MFKIRSIAARLILAILFAVAITVGILGAFSIVQQRSLTRLALEDQLKQQYDGVVAAIDYEGRAALAVSTLLAALPPVADAIAKGDRAGLLGLLAGSQRALEAQGIPRVSFMLPPATAFLRVKEPTTFGDDVSARRATIVLANKEARSVVGVEMGPEQLAIYGMTPVMRDGRSLGVVDIGAAFGQKFVDDAKRRFGVDLAVHNFKDGRLTTLAATFGNDVATPAELKAAFDGAAVSRTTELNGHPAVLYLGQVKNYSGQAVGVLLLVKDTTR